MIGASVFKITYNSEKDDVLLYFSENVAVSESLADYLQANIHEEVDSLC